MWLQTLVDRTRCRDTRGKKGEGRMVTVATEPEFYTVKEVADRLRVSAKTIYRLVERGELRAIRLGDVYRIPREEFEALRRGERPE